MKIALFVLAGLAIGAVAYRIPHYVDDYSQKGLPDREWAGPRMRRWKNGVEILGD